MVTNIPNFLTGLRLVAVPVLVVLLSEQQYAYAFVVFLVAALTDGLDGYIAKRFECATRLGAILDPVADKMLILSVFVMLTMLGEIPLWLLLLVTLRDVSIVGAYLILNDKKFNRSLRPQPSRLGKINTFLQISLVVLVLVENAGYFSAPVLVDLFILAVAAGTLWSGLHYAYIWFIRRQPDVR